MWICLWKKSWSHFKEAQPSSHRQAQLSSRLQAQSSPRLQAQPSSRQQAQPAKLLPKSPSQALADKPKIFLIQICKDQDVERKHCDRRDRGENIPNKDLVKVSDQADFLIYKLHSTGSGEEANLFIGSISEVVLKDLKAK